MPTTIDPKRNVKAVHREVFDADGGAPDGLCEDPGVCQWFAEDRRLGFCCPGCGRWGAVLVGNPKPVTRPSWEATDGDPADPTTLTLSPSIHCVGCCGWHGYLRGGAFQSC